MKWRTPPTAPRAGSHRSARRDTSGASSSARASSGPPCSSRSSLLALSRSWRCRTTDRDPVHLHAGLLRPAAVRLRHPRHAAADRDDRDRHGRPGAARHREATLASADDARAWTGVRACWPYLLALTLLGALAGRSGLPGTGRPRHPVSILLAQPPVYLSTPEAGDDESSPGDVTIDTEAALLISRQSLSRVVGTADPAALDELRKRVRVTAAPNTSVLTIEVRDTRRREVPQAGSRRSPAPTCVTRRDYLSNRRDQTLALLREQLAELPARRASVTGRRRGSEARARAPRGRPSPRSC